MTTGPHKSKNIADQAPKTLGGLASTSTLFPPTQGLLGRPNTTGRTHWGTRFGYFGTDRILQTYLAGTEVLALRFTARTRFGAIDLDATSPYHTLRTVAALFTAAQAHNLRPTLCRSSESGGWHVYLWAQDFVASASMHATLRAIAESAGIDRFENGVCEIYPDPNHAKQAFRLPAQAGFAWLSSAPQPTPLSRRSCRRST